MCYDAIMFPGNHLEMGSNGLLLAFKHLQHPIVLISQQNRFIFIHSWIA